MKKYILVISGSIQEYFAYRLNFILWRVRVVISILISYFLWQAVFQVKNQIFGYNESQMLTYIILITFISSIVLSSQTSKVAEEINYGNLSNFLLRPINYFGVVFARDISDKAINTVFSIIELILLIFLLKTPILVQTEVFRYIFFLLATVFASLLYFEIGMILSIIGFWSKETWAPRFIFFILVSFLAGTYFPLDILPSPIYVIMQLLPFMYLIFFPLKIYLGPTNFQFIYLGFTVVCFWILGLWLILQFLWKKGLKVYTSEGS